MTVQTTSVQTADASVALIRNWPLTLFSAALLLLLVGLGCWQLQRAGEKAALTAAIDTRLAAQPRNPSTLAQLQRYSPVRLQGHYTDERYYLDNRTRNGSAGYEILQVFIAADQRWLINRGWVAAGNDRDVLPAVQWPRAAKVITGFLYPVSASTASEKSVAMRIQNLDRGFTAPLRLAHPHWNIRLSADSDTALVTDWQLLNFPPQRHIAYAVQWFAMAAALAILWLYAATGLRDWLKNNNYSLKR
ncbi:SURF1 family protein [Microbulbifer sp. SAOS-129_SWC]|uniref:SURF1 family protein n=1 Tax=Microbulbifer sp. SAOS-129_SWC TaxID=3145235 RepID=UPI003216F578